MIQMDIYVHTPQTDIYLRKGKKYFRVMDRKITKVFFAIMGFVFLITNMTKFILK